MISRRLRCKDTHSTNKKLEKLFDLADKLGIWFEIDCGVVVVHDKDRDKSLPQLFLEDIEDDHKVYDIPPMTEYKLVYDNPEYLKQQAEESERYRKEVEAKKAKEEAAKKAKELKQEKERKQRIEIQERAQLESLQKKYNL